MKKFLLVIIFALQGVLMFSQGSMCADPQGINGATPFCSITGVEFPNCNFNNSECRSSSEVGPDYGCLGSTPFPAWYFMQIEQQGDISLRIEQTSLPDGEGFGLDVDFICWGPFSDPVRPCQTQLTAANIIGCSFSADFIENFTVNNAQAGDFYLLLVTNFSQQQGFINFGQTFGQGATDCSILTAALGPNQNICGNEPIELNGETEGAVSYEWFIFNENTSNFDVIEDEQDATLRVESSGRYQIAIEDLNGDRETDEVVISFLEPPLIEATITNLTECEENNGEATFNFDSIEQAILGNLNASDFSVSFYTSQEDADRRLNPIGNQFTTSSTTILARLERSALTDCFTTTSFDVIINLQPIFQEESLEYILCEQSDTSQEEATIINVDSIIDELTNELGNQVDLFSEEETTAISDFDISYHRSPLDVLNNRSPIINGDSLLEGQQIYVRAEKTSLGFECFNANSIPSITIKINQNPVFRATDIPFLTSCAISVSQQNIALFDLRENDINISSELNRPSTQVLYYLSESNFRNNFPIEEIDVRNFQNTINPQIIYASLDDPSSNCDEEIGLVSFELRVLSLPQSGQTTINNLAECEENNGEATFNFDSIEQAILGNLNASDFSVSFYRSQEDADRRLNPIGNQFTTSSTTILARLERSALTDCFTTTSFDVNVNLQPIFQEESLEYILCEQSDTSQEEATIIDVGSIIEELTNELGNQVDLFSEEETTAISDFDISYHRSALDVLNNRSPIINGDLLFEGQQIYVRAEKTSLGFECFNANSIPSITIKINQNPIFRTIDIPFLTSCAISVSQQNIALFDLRENDINISSELNRPTTQVLYYLSESNFRNNFPIEEIDVRNFQNTINPQIIYASLDDPSSNCDEEIGLVSFELRAVKLPELSLNNIFTGERKVCVFPNADLINNIILGEDLGLIDGEKYIYDWTPNNIDADGDGEEDVFFEVNNLQEATKISLTITRENSFNLGLDCRNNIDINSGLNYEVILQPTSAPESIDAKTLTKAFVGEVFVEAIASLSIGDLSDLEYKIGEGEYQDSPVFENVIPSITQITVRNKFGCSPSIQSEIIELLEFAKFFTPNNDGINDTWNLISTQIPNNAEVFIFDRFGKLIKQVFSNGEGWDGTYIGKLMPSSSYWFRVEYEELTTRESKVLTGSFLLKR